MQRYTNRNILKITLPVLVSLLMEQLVGLTDTIYLGHYGDGRTELAASALAGVFYLVVFMLGFGFSVGAQVLIARRNGEGRLHEIGPVFMQGSLFLLLLAALLFALSRLCAEGLFSLLVEQQAVRRAAVDYLDWRVWGFFFSFAAAMFRALYVGTTRTRILTANSVVMVLTNVVLNYLLISAAAVSPSWASPVPPSLRWPPRRSRSSSSSSTRGCASTGAATASSASAVWTSACWATS